MPKRLLLFAALQCSLFAGFCHDIPSATGFANGLPESGRQFIVIDPSAVPSAPQPSPSVDVPDTAIHPYQIHSRVDVPIIVAAAAIDIYNFSEIGKKDGTPVEKLSTLKISDIDWFDRWAVHPYSKNIDKLSYIPFYVAMPLPMVAFGIDKRMRKDFWQLTFLYGEAMTLTGVLYTSAVHYIHRLRPLVYEPTSPEGTRTSSNSRNSFFAGHVALVGTSVFFIAQAWADYHPESNKKWIFYTGAGAITALTAYWRNMAGEHFPTDIAVGTTIGVASGLLTPMLHRTRLIKNKHLSVLPFTQSGSQGMAILYKF